MLKMQFSAENLVNNFHKSHSFDNFLVILAKNCRFNSIRICKKISQNIIKFYGLQQFLLCGTLNLMQSIVP